MAACKDALISHLLWEKEVKDQAEDLIIRVTKLQRKLNFQPR